MRPSRSVTVKLLRVWENVTPNAEVVRDVLDDSYLLDNTKNEKDLEHFFCNVLDAGYEIKMI